MSKFDKQLIRHLVRMARDRVDVAAWIAFIITEASLAAGGDDRLLAGRPGSWESDLVRQLSGAEYLRESEGWQAKKSAPPLPPATGGV
jgi:hypothetical protein